MNVTFEKKIPTFNLCIRIDLSAPVMGVIQSNQ